MAVNRELLRDALNSTNNYKSDASLSRDLNVPENIQNISLNPANFGNGLAGETGIAAQLGTAIVGAYGKYKAEKTLQEKELAAQTIFASKYPQFADLSSQLSPSTREAYILKDISKQSNFAENGAPAQVQEYNFYKTLDPIAQNQYMNLKRTDPYNVAYDRQLGKGTAESQINLGATIDNSDYLITKTEDLKTDSGFADSVGIKGGGAILQNIGINKIVPGTDAAGFKSKMSQIEGGAFLEAFDTLRGGGQITEMEGEKATRAKNRMQTATSEAEFIKAADDFISVVKTGKNRAVSQARGEFGKPNNQAESNNNIFQSSNGVKFTIKR